MNEVDLGKQLQRARQKAGLTQQELCQKAGLSYSTLAKIERGAIQSPSIFTIQSIAETLGLTLDQLIGNSSAAGTEAPKKQSKGGVRFVYFDINGCLVRFYHHAFTQLAKDTGARADTIESTFWHFNDAVCRGEMSMDNFNRALAESLGGNNIDWQYYYMNAVAPITEMHELLAWAADHYHVGLLSNIMPGFIPQMMEKQLVPQLNYAAIIDSSEVKAIKPEQRIFEVAQERAGSAPGEILLVDDARGNIMAAEHMGWKVLWFDDMHPSESVERIRQALEFN